MNDVADDDLSYTFFHEPIGFTLIDFEYLCFYMMVWFVGNGVNDDNQPRLRTFSIYLLSI